MSSSDMTSLKNSAVAAFDEIFLQMMIQRHEGAITMDDAELKAATTVMP